MITTKGRVCKCGTKMFHNTCTSNGEKGMEIDCSEAPVFHVKHRYVIKVD